MELKTNGNYHPVQLNETINFSLDGKISGKSLMINIRNESPEKVWTLYQGLKRLIEGREDVLNKKVNQEKSEVPSCPSCGKPMVLRQNGKKGDFFWGCVSYPFCRGTRQHQKEREEISVIEAL